jgi:acyl carrier protein
MNENAILTAVRAAAAEEADIPPESCLLTSQVANIPGWDSLAHTRIIMNLEERLKVEVDMELTMQAATVGDLVIIVQNTLDRRS